MKKLFFPAIIVISLTFFACQSKPAADNSADESANVESAEQISEQPLEETPLAEEPTDSIPATDSLATDSLAVEPLAEQPAPEQSVAENSNIDVRVSTRLSNSGAEGGRTPVRRPEDQSISERSLCFDIPSI